MKETFLDAIFVDFRTAFDTESRTRIIEKLKEDGSVSRCQTLFADVLLENPVTVDERRSLLDGGVALTDRWFRPGRLSLTVSVRNAHSRQEQSRHDTRRSR